MAKIIATGTAQNNTEAYETEIAVRHHEMIADEPVEVGGKDKGPAPGDYLCMALASCKAITLRMYAQRKQWAIGNIHVKVNLVKGEDSPSGNNTFFCELSFSGVVDTEQEKRLQQIAKSCPISRLLNKANEVVTIVSPAR